MRAEGRKEGERGLRRGFLGGAEGMEGGQAWLPGCGSDSKRNVHVFVFILANERVFCVAVGRGMADAMRIKSGLFLEFDTLYFQICVSFVKCNYIDFQHNKLKTPQNVCAAGI